MNPETRSSLSLDVVARVANVFLQNAAEARGEEVLECDVDDVIGVCISLIDQVCCLRISL
jgi:hypothetical protein